MAYNINDMPQTLEEWEILVTTKTQESQAAYDAKVAEVTAQATAQYALLPDDENKLSLNDYINQAIGFIEPAKTRADFEAMYACYYPQPQEQTVIPPLTTEQLFAQLRSIREVKLREYDTKISQLDRLIREHPDYAAYAIERSQWDAYATALCNLPSMEGAPWDGGLSETPWPAKPE